MSVLLLKYITTIFGILMSFGYYPQAYKMFKTKSAENISIISFAIFSIGTLLWTIYGFYLHDWTLISGFIFGVLGAWSIFIMAIVYKKRAKLAKISANSETMV